MDLLSTHCSFRIQEGVEYKGNHMNRRVTNSHSWASLSYSNFYIIAFIRRLVLVDDLVP